MNLNSKEIERHKPVWLAISEFYLDKELGAEDNIRLISIFKESGFSLFELKDIDYFHVKPIVSQYYGVLQEFGRVLIRIGFGRK